MAQANKNTASVHRFVETASVGAISTHCGNCSDLAAQAWVTSAPALLDNDGDPQACARGRRDLSDGCSNLPVESRLRLGGDARRVIALSKGKGPAAITVVERGLYKYDDAEGSLRSGFDAQTDDLGRALFLLIRVPDLFEEAERTHYAEHYRNFGKLYQAVEVDCDHLSSFEWNDANRTAFESKIKDPDGHFNFPHQDVHSTRCARLTGQDRSLPGFGHRARADSGIDVGRTGPDADLVPRIGWLHRSPPARRNARST